MRTTVTLDSDTEQIVRQRMKDRRVSFKQALNDLVREGRDSIRGPQEFRTSTAAMGQPTVNLDKALHLAGELEDDELVRRMQTRS
ncbi:MAG: antitoxin [bacterium]|nr:antitoxin [bacterium]MCY4135326.1 antitoxin [bacterium]